jgi:hypothetical protein
MQAAGHVGRFFIVPRDRVTESSAFKKKLNNAAKYRTGEAAPFAGESNKCRILRCSTPTSFAHNEISTAGETPVTGDSSQKKMRVQLFMRSRLNGLFRGMRCE